MIRVGTDCSGIEAPIQALEQLGIPFKHVFSCDIDKYVRESINANYEPEIIFKDMTKRKLNEIPNIDLYICGFPCQSFSLAGKRRGTNDKRGTIFWECLRVIKKKLPKVFILENVKGLLSIDEGETFEEIIKSLEKIKKYKVYWKLLNTREYGIPQNRERVFIIGIRRDQYINFEWPEKKPMYNIREYVDWNDDREKDNLPPALKKSKFFEKIPKDSVFVDISFSSPNNTYPHSNLHAPCLNTQSGMWCVPLQRRANVKELLSLQGFPKDFVQVISNTQMKKQIGNSMSVNILRELFTSIFN